MHSAWTVAWFSMFAHTHKGTWADRVGRDTLVSGVHTLGVQKRQDGVICAFFCSTKKQTDNEQGLRHTTHRVLGCSRETIITNILHTGTWAVVLAEIHLWAGCLLWSFPESTPVLFDQCPFRYANSLYTSTPLSPGRTNSFAFHLLFRDENKYQ